MASTSHGNHSRVESLWADIDGPVHYVDHGGPADGPLLVCVHGLGGSLLNWAALAPLLTDTCRVVALDLAGFGHTRGGSRSTSVQANQLLLHRFLTEVTGSPVILVGNSMGGLISILQAAAHPKTVAGLVLIDPALPMSLRARPDLRVFGTFAAFLVPAVGRRLLARRRSDTSAEDAARALLELCCV
ncbi:MAG: alpha/beta fold hydrolase, partial [bacterium]|nr:alpha/beta fold hydrolase [bacterium]